MPIIKEMIFPPPTLLYPLGNIPLLCSLPWHVIKCHVFLVGWSVGGNGGWGCSAFFQLPFMTVHLYLRQRGRERMLAFATQTSQSIDMPFISQRRKKNKEAQPKSNSRAIFQYLAHID